MQETGTVVEISGDRARIEFSRTSACGSCRACHFSQDGKTVFMEVSSGGKMEKGDRVRMALESRAVMKAAAILYLIPLAGIIAGVAAAQVAGAPAIFQLLAGITGALAGGLIVRVIDKKIGRRNEYVPRIVEIWKK